MDRVSGRRRAHATLLHMLMVYVPCLSLIKSLKGVQGLSLCSSPSSEDGIISVCPATTVTLTCTASGVVALGWRNQNGAIRGFSASDPESMVIEEGPYTLTLVSVDNDDGDSDADLTSTLEVTYSCDTHLVLVGETVTTCSLPSLTWLPCIGNVTCVQPSAVAPSTTPSIHSTSPRNSIGVIAGSVLASLFLVGITVVTLIVLVFVYKDRLKKWKVSRVVQDNCYGAQEMLMRPGSSTGTLSVSTSPPLHSPRALPSYDVITTTGSSVPYYSHVDPTTEASGNGSSSTVVYSETIESMRRVVASHSTDDGLVTSHQPTLPSQYSTMGPTSLQAPQGEKYAELVFESSGGPPMPSLDTLVPPVQYTMVKPSNKPHPKSHRPDPCERSDVSVGPDKHPLEYCEM
ncbi:hypothetical protein GBAR_LOCUS15746 [Geodia barretti]|uniref:Uncharacterized protein n=1 Tax=Geodia barretti TaxID=519541 RepID=A0AA35SDA5_GEOBA|nr:hypothetical protein GBAR_LOCUS15746 [Geodia barretti]